MGITVAGCSSRDSQDQSPAQMVDLGEKLFLDARLSRDGRVSCATCHDPKRLFTDGRATPVGVNRQSGTRNAPSLLDVAVMESFFWDGRETDLRQVVLQPFTNTVEMGLADQNALVQRIRTLPDYSNTFSTAFSGDSSIDAEKIGRAIAAYLRALPVQQSRYDAYLASNRRLNLSDEELAGLRLFNGKAACSGCHSLEGKPAALTDQQFHHTGIGFDKVAGNIGAMISTLETMKTQGRPIGNAVLSDQEVAELGRFATTRRPADLGAFRTPSLRNVALTGPYMHDGSVTTLREAVEREIYYRSLARGRPISLTVEEQGQLIAFLQSLTDQAALKQQTSSSP